MTEQDAPESSNICVSQLFILPATHAVLILLEFEGKSADKQSIVRAVTGTWEHLLLGVWRCPPWPFPEFQQFLASSPTVIAFRVLKFASFGWLSK